MVQITPADLRRMTEEAISSATRELTAKTAQIFSAAMQHLKADVTAGRQFSVAMSLKAGDDYQTGTRSAKSLRPEQLTGVAALVYGKCRVFNPTLEYWSRVEGCQRDEYTVEGFNIVLHWSNVDDLLAKLEGLNDDTTARAIREGILAAQSAIADKAAGILGQLKEKATIQARSGKSWAIVMSVKSGTDFDCPAGARITQIQPEWLGPVARAVWDACASFAPTFEYWSREEGDQRDSYTVEGINIIVHW
jgi:outer membrane murein-binding lipoprotein Lpp